MIPPPDLRKLTEAEKDALILALWAQVQTLTARVAELEARLNQPPKTPNNSSLPPSKGHPANGPEKGKRTGPRQGSLGRAGGGRPLAEEPDQLVIAKAAACAHCRAALAEADQVLHARYDKIELPPVRPVVTRVERHLGRRPCCGGATLAPVPGGMDEGSPFGVSILALAPYLRFTHAIIHRRLTRLCLHLFGHRQVGAR
jgi:transposase